jgi:hypothetical protein
MDTAHLLPSSRSLRVLDAGMALWVAAWIGLGVAIGVSVHHLTDLSHTVSLEGSTVQAVGRALGTPRPSAGHPPGSPRGGIDARTCPV